MFDSINLEQGRYVLAEGDGYSCLGFDVALQWGAAIAQWCGCQPPNPKPRGTQKGYEDYQRILEQGRKHYEITNKRCPTQLCPQLVGLEGKRVEVTQADGRKRRFYVGKSTGWLPIHLEIKRRNSHGGVGVLENFQSVRVVAS